MADIVATTRESQNSAYNNFQYYSYPGEVNFDIDTSDTITSYDTPMSGSLTSVNNGGSVSAGTYNVNAIAFDASSNEWWRIDDNGSYVWIPKSSSAKPKNGDTTTSSGGSKDTSEAIYNSLTKTQEYQNGKNVADNLKYQQQLYDEYYRQARESVGEPTAMTLTYNNDVLLVSRSLVDGSGNLGPYYTNLDEYFHRMNNVFGLPPMWNPYSDPVVEFSAFAIGRRYSQIILGNPTVISMTPGVMKYAKETVDTLKNGLSGMSNDSLIETFSNDNIDMLWKFEETWDNGGSGKTGGGYLNYVNVICQYAIYCMTVEENQYREDSARNQTKFSDRTMPDAFKMNGQKYSNFQINGLLGGTSTYTGDDGSVVITGQNFFETFANINMAALKRWFGTWESIGANVGAGIRGDNFFRNRFVHFAVNGQSSVRESFSTETRSSVIETAINGSISDIVKDIAFIGGSAIFGEDGTADTDIKSIMSYIESGSGLGGAIGNLLKSSLEMLRGGQMSFPQMIGDVTWGREYSFTVKFSTVYGDVESRFLNVIMPYICLLCLWLPRQLPTAMDMYAYPFVVQAYANGIFACPAGVLTGIEVTRGGGDETGWTGGGQVMEIDVSFTIRPLHSKLMMSRDSAWFIKNVGMQQYIGTICGVDLTMPQKELVKATADMFRQFFDPYRLKQNIESSIIARLKNNGALKFLGSLMNFGPSAASGFFNGY